MWTGIRETLPHVSIHGCAFHWAQAVFRKVKEVGLQTSYHRQPQVRSFIRQLMALPHLPANHIERAFFNLQQHCPDNTQLKTVVDYIGKSWVHSTKCPPSSWSSFKRPVRTNNDAEGWHHSLNSDARGQALNLYLLIQLLHKEASLLPIQIKLVQQKKLYRQQRKSQKTKYQRLELLTTQYVNEEIDTSSFLIKCSSLAEYSED